ncbi:hypothetical protein J6590_005570 [Homalodisca vitripennis]|nr:hypothetical protein J6590_005570 [Homalodisca vitripennis]
MSKLHERARHLSWQVRARTSAPTAAPEHDPVFTHGHDRFQGSGSTDLLVLLERETIRIFEQILLLS